MRLVTSPLAPRPHRHGAPEPHRPHRCGVGGGGWHGRRGCGDDRQRRRRCQGAAVGAPAPAGPAARWPAPIRSERWRSGSSKATRGDHQRWRCTRPGGHGAGCGTHTAAGCRPATAYGVASVAMGRSAGPGDRQPQLGRHRAAVRRAAPVAALGDSSARRGPRGRGHTRRRCHRRRLLGPCHRRPWPPPATRPFPGSHRRTLNPFKFLPAALAKA